MKDNVKEFLFNSIPVTIRQNKQRLICYWKDVIKSFCFGGPDKMAAISKLIKLTMLWCDSNPLNRRISLYIVQHALGDRYAARVYMVHGHQHVICIYLWYNQAKSICTEKRLNQICMDQYDMLDKSYLPGA